MHQHLLNFPQILRWVFFPNAPRTRQPFSIFANNATSRKQSTHKSIVVCGRVVDALCFVCVIWKFIHFSPNINKKCLYLSLYLVDSANIIFNLPIEWLSAYHVVCSTEHQVVNLLIWFWLSFIFLFLSPASLFIGLFSCPFQWFSNISTIQY